MRVRTSLLAVAVVALCVALVAAEPHTRSIFVVHSEDTEQAFHRGAVGLASVREHLSKHPGRNIVLDITDQHLPGRALVSSWQSGNAQWAATDAAVVGFNQVRSPRQGSSLLKTDARVAFEGVSDARVACEQATDLLTTAPSTSAVVLTTDARGMDAALACAQSLAAQSQPSNLVVMSSSLSNAAAHGKSSDILSGGVSVAAGATPEGPKYITSNILYGLLVSLLLIVALFVGVCCLFGISTPERFARKNLPGGKEF